MTGLVGPYFISTINRKYCMPYILPISVKSAIVDPLHIDLFHIPSLNLITDPCKYPEMFFTQTLIYSLEIFFYPIEDQLHLEICSLWLFLNKRFLLVIQKIKTRPSPCFFRCHLSGRFGPLCPHCLNPDSAIISTPLIDDHLSSLAPYLAIFPLYSTAALHHLCIISASCRRHYFHPIYASNISVTLSGSFFLLLPASFFCSWPCPRGTPLVL